MKIKIKILNQTGPILFTFDFFLQNMFKLLPSYKLCMPKSYILYSFFVVEILTFSHPFL